MPYNNLFIMFLSSHIHTLRNEMTNMQFNQIKSLWLIKPAYLGTKHKTRLRIRINFYLVFPK